MRRSNCDHTFINLTPDPLSHRRGGTRRSAWWNMSGTLVGILRLWNRGDWARWQRRAKRPGERVRYMRTSGSSVITYGCLGGLFTGIVCSFQVIGCGVYLGQIEASVAGNTAPGQFVDGNAVVSRPLDIFNQTLPLVALFALLMYAVIGYLAGRASRTNNSARAGMLAAVITAMVGWLLYLFAACTVSAQGLHPWTPFTGDEVGTSRNSASSRSCLRCSLHSASARSAVSWGNVPGAS